MRGNSCCDPNAAKSPVGAEKGPVKTRIAVVKSGARNRIQPNMTNWNVISSAVRHALENAAGRASTEPLHQGNPGTVPQSPENKRPIGAVPKSAKRHRDENVGDLPTHAVSIAAERNVQIVSEPSGQRNMPA